MKRGDYLIAKKTIKNGLGWPLFIEGYPYEILNIDKDYVILDHYLYANEYAEYKIEYVLENFIIMENLKRDVLICQCNSLEHQYSFYYSKDDGLYCEPHLSTYLPFYKRLILAFKYIFGYKTKYGSFDEFLFKKEDLEKLERYIKIVQKDANKNDISDR